MKKNLHSIYYYIETTQTPVLKFNTVYTIHDKKYDFLDDNGEGENIFLYFFLFGEKILSQNVSPFMASVLREKMNLPPKCAFPLQ